jgi:hypothetical protein
MMPDQPRTSLDIETHKVEPRHYYDGMPTEGNTREGL